MLSFLSFTGAGIGLVNAPSVLIVGVYFTKKIHFAHGLVMTGGCTGQLIFSALFAYLHASYGWRGTSLIFAAICANVMACGAIFRPLKRHTRRHSTDASVQVQLRKIDVTDQSIVNPPCSTDIVDSPDFEQIQEKSSKVRLHLSRISTINVCIKNPILVVHQLCTFCRGAATLIFLAHIVNKAVIGGISKGNAAMLLFYAGIGNVLSRSSHGWLIDKGFVSAQTLFLISSIFCAVEALIFALTNIYSILAVLSFFAQFYPWYFSCTGILHTSIVGTSGPSGSSCWTNHIHQFNGESGWFSFSR